MTPLKAFPKTMAILAVAAALAVAVCALPQSAYQRWQLLDGTDYETLHWAYERIHFDPRPVDIAIVGPSKTLNGLSAGRIEERLTALGHPANVANFSVVAAGRNTDWAIVRELYKTKSPKLIVIGVGAIPHPYGHPAFKYIAPALAIVAPPAPLLHNFFYDLAYLPFRQLKLFGAWLFPGASGLKKDFNLEAYERTRSDYTSTFTAAGRRIDMDRKLSREALLAQFEPLPGPTRAARLMRLFNAGDDHVYLREIARLARAHGARLMFVFLPTYDGSTRVADRSFLEQYGEVANFGDLSKDNALYMNIGHLNHAGAMIASDRLAGAIVASAF